MFIDVFSPQLCVGFLFLFLYPAPPPPPPASPPPTIFHTHTHTCIRPQLVRRSPTASSSLILQVLKNHTWASCAQRPDKPTLIHEFKGGFMWDPQLRPLRPGASLAGTFTHLSMTVFVGRSVKDRPAAPCLSKKHKTEHLTTFFALSRQGLTHTISLQGRSFFIDIEGMVLLWYTDERLDVSKNKLQYV